MTLNNYIRHKTNADALVHAVLSKPVINMKLAKKALELRRDVIKDYTNAPS